MNMTHQVYIDRLPMHFVGGEISCWYAWNIIVTPQPAGSLSPIVLLLSSLQRTASFDTGAWCMRCLFTFWVKPLEWNKYTNIKFSKKHVEQFYGLSIYFFGLHMSTLFDKPLWAKVFFSWTLKMWKFGKEYRSRMQFVKCTGVIYKILRYWDYSASCWIF